MSYVALVAVGIVYLIIGGIMGHRFFHKVIACEENVRPESGDMVGIAGVALLWPLVAGCMMLVLVGKVLYTISDKIIRLFSK